MNNTVRKNVIRKIMKIEGDFSNDPADSGGKTKFGITEETARSFGYKGKMIDLTADMAIDIYEKLYWQPLRLDNISILSIPLAEELFDTGVNMGIITSGMFLQRTLNAVSYRNESSSLYDDLVVDGRIGIKTIEALNIYCSSRKRDCFQVLLKALNCLQGNAYIELVEERKKDKKFINGWPINRVSI
jgi:lysozyme family protein